MMIIRPTKNLIKEMKVQVESAYFSEEDILFSWHANNFLLNKRKHLIFMNDKSRLSITVSGVRSNQYKDLNDIFFAKLKDYLLAEGIKEDLVNRYISEKEEIHFLSTNNRSVIGTITESIKIMEYLYDGEIIPSFQDLNKKNNRIIYKPIDYEKPIDLFTDELNKQYN